jgi:transcription initiation factor TFIIB
LIDRRNGELVCQNCGFVISSNQLNRGPEWRTFDHIDREKLPRVGAPLSWSRHDKGLSTKIGRINRDYQGRLLSPDKRSKLYRLRKWHRRTKVSDSKHRNLVNALSEIDKISDKLNLPRNIIETSSIIYRQALNKKLIRGRKIKSIVVASIYMACRQCGVIRTLKDIAYITNITKKDAARSYRLLYRQLKPNVPPINRSKYISRIINKLRLSGETELIAERILAKAAEQKFTSGRGPAGMSAACIYISCQLTGESRTQHEIAIAAQITEVTIRNRYKELLKNMEFNLLL